MALRRLLAYPGTGVRKSRQYALVGLVYCDCGQKMRSQKRYQSKIPIFSCLPKAQGGCGSRTIKIEELEDLITKLMFARLEKVELDPEGDDGLRRDLEHQIIRWEAKLLELADEYENGDSSAREMRQAGDRIREKISTVGRQIAELGVRRTIGMNVAQLREAWDTEEFGLDRRRSIFAAEIERIEIGPHTGNRAIFDRSRVHITWK